MHVSETMRRVNPHCSKGDKIDLGIYETCAEYLGRSLSILIDILWPTSVGMLTILLLPYTFHLIKL